MDRNRYKGLCRTKAESDGIKTARLPIGDYVKLHAAPVMTVNQVRRLSCCTISPTDVTREGSISMRRQLPMHAQTTA